MQKIVPNIWFDGTAEEAVNFYTSVFSDGHVLASSRYPTEGLLDFQKDLAGEILTIDFTIEGFELSAINAGPNFRPNPSISFFINFDPRRDPDAEAALDRLWDALIDGGRALMPRDAYPFSPRYGWVEDRYGVSWQLTLVNVERAGEEYAPPVMPSLLFGAEAQNRAHEALKFYTSVFPASAIGTEVPYGQAQGPASAESIVFADFTLSGIPFAAMDSAVEQPESFTEGVSLVVNCSDQAEIDRLWKLLSHVPEAEQCGWCKDQFGVSWQIVPADMEALMSKPGAFEKMLAMKKFVIADF